MGSFCFFCYNPLRAPFRTHESALSFITMKKTIIFGLFASILALLGASVAHAEDGTNVSITATNAQGERQEIRMDTQTNIKGKRMDLKAFASSTRADIKGMRQDFRNASGTKAWATSTKDKRMELKAEIDERKQELESRRASTTADIKMTKVTETMKLASVHLTSELTRLGDIKTKIDSRLSKFDQAGASTTAARADLATAVSLMTTAQTKIAAVSTISASTTDAKASADAVRQAVKDAQSAINDAQKALMQVVSDMRGLEASVRVGASATSTRD